MRLAPGVEALELTLGAMGPGRAIYPVVLRDGSGEGGDGVTLIDTGAPGETEALAAELGRLGLSLESVDRVLLTHQDLDHIGGLPQVVRASGAQVMAHADDLPYIQGERPPIKWREDRRAAVLQAAEPERRAELAQALDPLPAARVDRVLVGGEVLPWHGGVRVIHTPGHTPGHISLLLEAHGLLIAGDALRVDGGRLLGPNAAVTVDMAEANRSVAVLAALAASFDRVHCHHGGPYGPGAAARLRELAGAGSAGPNSV